MTAPQVPTAPDVQQLESIEKVYERLGLTSAQDRLRYAAPHVPQRAKPNFIVTISNTSTPFAS